MRKTEECGGPLTEGRSRNSLTPAGRRQHHQPMITMTLIPGVLSKAGAVSGAVPRDRARTTWNGLDYETQSRNGASMPLARDLIAAGCPEQPWEARDEAGKRTVFGDSLAALARTTITKEGRFTRWAPHPRADDDA